MPVGEEIFNYTYDSSTKKYHVKIKGFIINFDRRELEALSIFIEGMLKNSEEKK
jgi:hypothetical protein